MRVHRFTRWHAAGLVWRYAPDVRGRDRFFSLVRGSRIPASLATAPYEVHFGPGLRATVPLTADGSFLQLFLAAFADPVLVPILEAVLGPGDCFWDVGANIGIYSLWASKLVGETGMVYAFEPVPGTRRWLTDLVNENSGPVVVQVEALSDREARVQLVTIPNASGLSHIADVAESDRSGGVEEALADVVEATSTTGDKFANDHRPPTLVKIDVEGHELAVITGLHDTIESVHPVVVFESPDTVGRIGDSQVIVDRFHAVDYAVWSLTTKGLAPFVESSATHNLVALHTTDHADVRALLAGTRFARGQNC